MLITPSSFNRDPWGYFFNQLGHMACGFALVYVVILAWFSAFGDVPLKAVVAGLAVLIYVVGIEAPQIPKVRVGRRSIADTVEDTLFATYGAGATVTAFTSISHNSSCVFEFSPLGSQAVWWFVTGLVHLMIGVTWRYIDRAQNGAKVCGQNPSGEPRP